MEEILRSFLKAAPGLEGCTVDWGSRPGGMTLPGVVLYLIAERNGHTHNQGADRAVMARVQIDAFAATFGQAKTIARAIKARLDGYNVAPFSGIFFDSARDLNEEGETGDARVFRTSQDFHVHYVSSADGFEPVQPEIVRWIAIDAAAPIGLDVGDPLALDVGALTRTNLPSAQPISYSVFLGAPPSGTTLNPTTGLILGEVDAPGLSVFVIRAQSGDIFATQTFVVDAPEPAVSFAGTGLQTLTIGTPYTLELAPLVDVLDPLPGAAVAYSVAAGTLPAGLSLDPDTGTVSGTPTTAGAASVRFRAALASGQAAEQTVAFNVPALPVPSVSLAPLTPVALVQVVDGGAVSLDLAPLTTVSNTLDLAAYSVVAGSLPTGVSLNALTGLISGTATGGGVFSFVVRATLPGGQQAVQTYTIQVIPVDLNREAVISGGTSGSIASPQTDLWGSTSVYALFRPSGTLTVSQSGWGTGYARGGGAPGGNCTATGQPGGGGGSGEYLEFRIWLEAGTYTVATAASAPAGSTFGNDTTITRDSDGLEILRAYGGSRGGNSNQAGVNNTNPGGSAGGGGGSGAVGPAGGTAAGLAAGRGTNGAAGANGVGGGAGGAMAAGAARNGGASAGRRVGSFPAIGNGGGGGGVASGTAGTGGGAGAGNGGVGNANGGNAGAYSGSGGGGAGTTVGRTGGAGASGEVLIWVRS